MQWSSGLVIGPIPGAGTETKTDRKLPNEPSAVAAVELLYYFINGYAIGHDHI